MIFWKNILYNILRHLQKLTSIFHGMEVNLYWQGLISSGRLLALQKKHKPAGSTIVNGIQTNGTLLNNEWCSFLAAEGFIVGISIDGPADLHNKNRRTRDNNNTFLNVIRGYELLQRYGILPEILCVVNADNVKHPLIVYNFFKQLGPKYITFLPLVEREPGSATGVSINSVPSGEFGVFLSEIFDEWVEKDIGKIKIQIFEEAARTAFNQEHTFASSKKIVEESLLLNIMVIFIHAITMLIRITCLVISAITLYHISLIVIFRKLSGRLNQQLSHDIALIAK